MKKSTLATLALTINFLISSCGAGQVFGPTITPTLSPTSTPTSTPLPPATFDNFYKFPNHSQITLTGRICLPDEQLSLGEFKTHTVIFFDKKNECKILAGKTLGQIGQISPRFIEMSIPIGTDKNHVTKLPEYYTYSDLEVITENGEIVGHGSIVEVTAFTTRSAGGIGAWIDDPDIISIVAIH